MGNIPKTLIYRIIHRENLDILLAENRLICPNNANNPNYISIGETDLIKQRGMKEIPIDPFGTMRDYISFYFGARSPMLYCIANGYDVQMRQQEDIIYLVSSIEDLEKQGCRYVFTDGHSFAAISEFFNNREHLNQIDWDVVHGRFWNNTPDDPDRKRRKEAECLVFKEIPFSAIIKIGVYNQNTLEYVSDIISDKVLSIELSIESDWYY